MNCGLVRAMSHARQRTFVLGFLSAMFVMSLWLTIFAVYTDLSVRKRSGDVDDHLMAQVNSPYERLFTQRLEWQRVKEGRSYALSAFVDRRGEAGPVIKVITMEKMGESPRLCLLWLPWRTEPTVVQAKFSPVPENHEKDYWIHIYSCPFNATTTTPLAVSLVPEVTKTPPNILQVQDISANLAASGADGEIVRRDFTVCVAVLHRAYNNVHELVEAIELNRMFGAQKIVIYDYSVGGDVAKYLKYYMDEKVVDVIKWSLPGEIDEDEIHYYGQLAAVNDCIYRYMYTTKYMILSDLDEIFVPRKFPNWAATMRAVTERSAHARWSGAYLLRNAFFPLDCEEQGKMRQVALIKRYNLRSLLKTIRLSQLWPHLVRSKYVLRPDAVTVAGIHYMWGFAGNYTHFNVSSSYGFLHHYRHYLNGCSSWREDSFMWTEDKFLLKYRREITKRVWRTMAIMGSCHNHSDKHSDQTSIYLRKPVL